MLDKTRRSRRWRRGRKKRRRRWRGEGGGGEEGKGEGEGEEEALRKEEVTHENDEGNEDTYEEGQEGK